MSAQSRGATLAVTEMQPSPPWARKASAVASSPESWQKPGADREPGAQRPRQIVGRVLDADDVASAGAAAPWSSTGMSTTRARRHVVDDDRQVDGVGDRLEVLVQPFLGRLVVIGLTTSAASAPACLACCVSSIASAVEFEPVPAITGTPCPSAASTQMLDDALVLVMAEGRRFAGRAAGHQAVGALVDLPVDEVSESLLVDRAVVERRDQRDERSVEHGFLREAFNSQRTIQAPAAPGNNRPTRRVRDLQAEVLPVDTPPI